MKQMPPNMKHIILANIGIRCIVDPYVSQGSGATDLGEVVVLIPPSSTDRL